ncbi:MAG: HEAT repeat domain-containing protein, partial [Chloroflexi bacterium]|nr:HEAT repeat domain-containing protein [Chloroflexota bacterium]
EKIIPAISEMGSAAIPLLLELTRSEDVDIRWWGVRALAASPHTRTVDLIPLLSDSAPEVRAATALALCHHPHEDAVEALIQALADEDALTAGLAGNARVKIGKSAVPSLLKVMNEARPGIRIAALRTLAEIRDHRAIPIMMKCMSEESALLQYWAQEGLEKLGLDMVYIKP